MLRTLLLVLAMTVPDPSWSWRLGLHAQDLDADGHDTHATASASDLGSALTPAATITATKDAGNPTFNFDSLPESIVKVGSTYWAAYQGNNAGTTDARLASATDRDGPWTAYGSNPIYTIASVPWAPGSTLIYAPHLMEDNGTFYLFYSVVPTSGGATAATNGIGVATASTVTGPYTDHGTQLLAPGAGATWDSRRVGEPAVIHHDGQWVMAYMGESSALTYQTSEKVGIATASTPTGTWTKSASNPVIDWGSAGAWDDALVADPSLFFANGYYWIWYTGAPDSNPSTTISLGLAYALDPTGAFTRYSGNPLVSPGAGGAWDDVWALRGSIYEEDGLFSGIYAGLDGTNYKGGNLRLNVVTPLVTAPTSASISALGFVGPILISDTPSTPLVFADLIQNEAQDDLVYADP